MHKQRILSFKHAFNGLWVALKEEPNFIIHVFITLAVILLGLFLKISNLDWIILAITIGLVLSLELTNTAIEEVVNSFTEEVHPAAKKAKDVAASAVLVAALTAIAVGLFIFLPYFIV
jgi:undecaprenol kinase